VSTVKLVRLPVAAAVLVTSLDGGGFTSSSQKILIVLAGVTVLVAGPEILSSVRSPLVLVLVAIGALSVVSAAWTIGNSTSAARWGLVILSYAVLAGAGERFGAWQIAIGIALLAAVEAVLGLRAAAAHALPDAERIAGSWRPGGSYQYPPALGLLQVMALPILLSTKGRARLLAAPCAILAGAVLGTADSRVDLALAALVLVIGVALKPRRATAAALIAAAALAGHLTIGADPPGRSLTTRPHADLVHGRFREWRAALETWFDRPVLGAGAAAYYQASAKHQGSDPILFAHDLPLELAAELGTLGLLLGLALYAAAADALRRARARPALWLLGPAVSAFLIANLVDWPWHLAGLGAAWAVAAGGLLAAATDKT
jgi:O-antigen ligase